MALKEYQLLYLDNDIPINRSFYCNNGDIKSRGLEVHVLDNSQAKDCTGLTLKMIIKVPSGDLFEATVANGLVTVLNATGGIYQVLFPDNMGKGRLIAEIQLSNAVPEVIVSRKFSLVSDGSLTSDGVISELPKAGILWDVIKNEAKRQADFEEVLNNTDVAVAEKFANLETEYATELTGVKSQLAEMAHQPKTWLELKAVAQIIKNGETIRLVKGKEYIADSQVLINKMNVEIDGNGATITVSTVDSPIKYSVKPASIDGGYIHNINFDNYIRSRNGCIQVDFGLGVKTENITGNLNSFGRPLVEYIDCYNAKIDNIVGHALGNVPAVCVTSKDLNVSSISVKNIFAQMGMAVFVGGVVNNQASSLLETVTLENIHYVLGTETSVFLAESTFVSAVGTNLTIDNATDFEIGQPIILGDGAKSEWNLISGIDGNTLNLYYPIVAVHSVGERVLASYIGMAIHGQNTYSVEITNPHLEKCGMGIDIVGARAVKIDSPFITGEALTTRAINIDPSRYVTTINPVFYDVLHGVYVSNKTGAWGATSNFIDMQIFSTIGTVTNPVTNNSGNPLMVQGDSSGNKAFNTDLFFNKSISVNEPNTKITKIQKTITAKYYGAIAANSTLDQAAMVEGAAVGDNAYVTISQSLPSGIIVSMCYIDQPGVVWVRLANITGAAIEPPTLNMIVTLIKN